MKHTASQYAKALHLALSDVKNDQADAVIATLIEVMRKNGDLARFENVVEAFEKYAAKEGGEMEAKVTMAHTGMDEKGIVDALNKMSGKKVKTTTEVDESLMGGVVIRMEDTLIDASVKNSLNNIRNTLSK